MKKISILFAAFAVLLLVSCGKYEDGPGFSLRSRASRIAGSWTIDKYTVGGVDYSSDLSGISWEFTKAGASTTSYTYAGQTFTENGTWALTSNDENFTMTDSSGDSESYKILRLTNSEFWFSETYSGVTAEYHLKAK